MDLSSIREAFERVSKKQRISESKTLEAIDKAIRELESAVKLLSRDGEGMQSALVELEATLNHESLQETESIQKELNAALGKYGKTMDKMFYTEIAKAYREVESQHKIINQIIASHFYRQGFFDLGDCFAKESLEPGADALKAPFYEMYEILENMKVQNLDPALEWARAHREELSKRGSVLEFQLHQLQFLQLLREDRRRDALTYARNNFGLFSVCHMREIQRLMCCLLWTGRLENCPYHDLFLPRKWDDIVQSFTQECCSLLGQSYESPLHVTLSAALQALPTLLKMATVLATKTQEWQTLKQLPMEIELGKEFQFHSVFACPVSKDQSTVDNPPMLMPCGHVLCKQTLQKLAKSHAFKCPYCPAEVTMTKCKPIIF